MNPRTCDFCDCEATSRLWHNRKKVERLVCDSHRDEKLADDNWDELSYDEAV